MWRVIYGRYFNLALWSILAGSKSQLKCKDSRNKKKSRGCVIIAHFVGRIFQAFSPPEKAKAPRRMAAGLL